MEDLRLVKTSPLVTVSDRGKEIEIRIDGNDVAIWSTLGNEDVIWLGNFIDHWLSTQERGGG